MDLSLWPLFVFCWFSFLLLYFLICFVILNIEMLIFLEIIWEFRKFWVAAPWKSFELYYYFSFYISNTNVGLKNAYGWEFSVYIMISLNSAWDFFAASAKVTSFVSIFLCNSSHRVSLRHYLPSQQSLQKNKLQSSGQKAA